ncbi:hypothetical protein OUZ56_012342 [Daphnia magna]|uniref:Uncharacterized protein n=1 Tax=Daphnia magna TaxID=35525 RepID=A0ABQ9Z2Q3_9CRUS|nr:hypothetical protein OUZ56_012342 [Daphnia magna]
MAFVWTTSVDFASNMNKNKLFSSRFEAYIKAFSEKKRQDCQKEVVEIWNKIKNESDLQLQKKGSLLGLWSKQLSTTAQKQNTAEDKFADSSTKINPTTEQIPLEFTPESDLFREPESETEIEQILVASN